MGFEQQSDIIRVTFSKDQSLVAVLRVDCRPKEQKGSG